MPLLANFAAVLLLSAMCSARGNGPNGNAVDFETWGGVDGPSSSGFGSNTGFGSNAGFGGFFNQHEDAFVTVVYNRTFSYRTFREDEKEAIKELKELAQSSGVLPADNRLTANAYSYHGKFALYVRVKGAFLECPTLAQFVQKAENEAPEVLFASIRCGTFAELPVFHVQTPAGK